MNNTSQNTAQGLLQSSFTVLIALGAGALALWHFVKGKPKAGFIMAGYSAGAFWLLFVNAKNNAPDPVFSGNSVAFNNAMAGPSGVFGPSLLNANDWITANSRN